MFILRAICLFLFGFYTSAIVAQTLSSNDAENSVFKAADDDLRLQLGDHIATFSSPQGLVWGRPDAEIQIVGFFDYTSLLDKRLFSKLPNLVEKHPELRIELRELPSSHPVSMRLSRFALATRMVHGEEGYRAMHLHILRMLEIPSRRILGLVAQEGRFDINRIDFALDATEITKHLQDNQHLYLSLGKPELPAFFTQDQVYSAVPTVEVLESLIFQR